MDADHRSGCVEFQRGQPARPQRPHRPDDVRHGAGPEIDDFKRVLRHPKAPAIGLAAQFILLPAFTFLLTLVLQPTPSIALGMILVAACPGGNLSNIMTYLAGGNASLSVGMTAVSTAAAIVMTPLNLSLWGNLNPATAPILRRSA